VPGQCRQLTSLGLGRERRCESRRLCCPSTRSRGGTRSVRLQLATRSARALPGVFRVSGAWMMLGSDAALIGGKCDSESAGPPGQPATSESDYAQCTTSLRGRSLCCHRDAGPWSARVYCAPSHPLRMTHRMLTARSGQVRFITRPKSRTMRAKRNKRSRANRTNVPK
jgi:hypothetical protein